MKKINIDFKKIKKPITALIVALILLVSLTLLVITHNTDKEKISEIAIENVSFAMTDTRIIDVTISNKGLTNIEIQEIYINGLKVLPWYAEKMTLKLHEATNLTIMHTWKSGGTYILKIVVNSSSSEKIVKAPVIHSYLDFEILNYTMEHLSNLSRPVIDYQLNSSGLSNVKVMAFLYKDYESSSKPIYVFYDHNYMPKETLKRAEVFIDLANKYGMNVPKANWIFLDELAKNKKPSILVVFNPLLNVTGAKIYNVLPSCIIDRNGNGYIKDDSKYEKSYIYDWMKDDGLIFITPDSTQPEYYIIYKDSASIKNKDNLWYNAAGNVFTDDGSIQWGYGGAGKPLLPLNIANILGLHTSWGGWAFVKEWMDNRNISYYPYGSFILEKVPSLKGKTVHTYLPIFIKVGKGGWLDLGDANEKRKLTDEQIAHDLTMILLHAPWNSEWLPYGWNYDSGLKTYSVYGGILNTIDTISIGWIPENATQSNYTLRFLVTGYDIDEEKYIKIDRLFNVKKI